MGQTQKLNYLNWPSHREFGVIWLGSRIKHNQLIKFSKFLMKSELTQPKWASHRCVYNDVNNDVCVWTVMCACVCVWTMMCVCVCVCVCVCAYMWILSVCVYTCVCLCVNKCVFKWLGMLPGWKTPGFTSICLCLSQLEVSTYSLDGHKRCWTDMTVGKFKSMTCTQTAVIKYHHHSTWHGWISAAADDENEETEEVTEQRRATRMTLQWN